MALRVGHARGARALLCHTLAEAGLEPEPSHANFVYADVPALQGDPSGPTLRGDGEGLARRLLDDEGVIVRALTGFGAPGAIRVTVGTDEENELFGAALGRVVLPSSR